MKDSVHIFLGANSGTGFFSLYDQLLNARLHDLLIIKGSPGGGKSSFMRTIAEKLAAQGEEVIYVNCSGDPDSLDGVLFPKLKMGVVDGTAPHALEPIYTLAAERYVDLSRFCDVARAKEARREIMAHTDAYRAAYAEAYRVLRAADALESERRAAVYAAMDFDRLTRRMENIARREFGRPAGARGRVDRAFLGGLTHQGELCRFDVVDALCPRVYALADGWGLAARALERVSDAAAEAGFDVLACPNPDRPRELRHVLVPAAGAAFVTETAQCPYPGKAYRRVRVDAQPLAALSRAERARARFVGRVERSLRDEAAELLRRAKREHDALESAYNPCVDFDGVYALAEAEAKKMLDLR